MVPVLRELALSMTQVVDLCAAALADVLTDRRLTIADSGVELAPRVGAHLTPGQRALWEGPGPYAAGQSLGEGVVHFCVRILTLRGALCFAARSGNRAQFVLVSQWCPVSGMELSAARAELLRRYLHWYGPATRAGFAAWVGLGPRDLAPWWELLAPELAEVAFRGTSWILAADLDDLQSAPPPGEMRLLPAHDPYLHVHDRESMVAGQYHRELWQAVGAPGAVLADGQIIGTWRPRKSGARLAVTIAARRALTARQQELLECEARGVAVLRGATSVRVDCG